MTRKQREQNRRKRLWLAAGLGAALLTIVGLWGDLR